MLYIVCNTLIKIRKILYTRYISFQGDSSVFICHESKKWRSLNINDRKSHDSIGKLSEKGNNKGENRVCEGFRICTFSPLEPSGICVSSQSG